MAEESINTFFIIFEIAIIMMLLVYSVGDANELKTVKDAFSVVGMKSSYFYRILSSPCLNNQMGSENKVKNDKFIIDKNKINQLRDTSSGIPVLTCLNMPYSKYQIHIKDIEKNEYWNFQNYQKSNRDKCQRIPPDYEMVIQINDNSVPTSNPLEVPNLDIYRVGLMSVGMETYASEDMLPDDIICENSAVAPDNFVAGHDYNTKVDDRYEYLSNKCESNNCIKGPGQANATCQPAGYKYNKQTDIPCDYDEECVSYNCKNRKCFDAPLPTKLVNCQPCLKDEECESGLCNKLHYCSDPP